MKKRLIVGTLLGMVLLGFSFFIFNFSPTGKVSLDMEERYVFGEQILGKLSFVLSENEFIPADSVLRVSLGSQNKEISFGEIFGSEIISGDFYVEGKSISGFGEGIGGDIIYPTLSFDYKIIQNSIPEENLEEENEVENNFTEEENVESEDTVEENPSPIEIAGSILTGAVISGTDSFSSGEVSKDSPFILDLNEGEEIEITSVNFEGEEISKDNLDVSIEGNQVTISTNYSVFSSGKILEIDLSQFNLTAEEGTLEVSLVYEENEIVSVSKLLEVVEIDEENETLEEVLPEIILNETLILNESNLTITTTVSNIRVGEPVKWKKIVKSDFAKENISVEIPSIAKNVSVKKIENVSEESLEEENSFSVSFITGNVVSGKVSLDVDLNKSSQGFFTKLWNKLFSFTGNVVSEEEIEKIQIVTIEENVTEVEITFETPAPTANESEISNGKQVVISGPDEIHYENVVAFSYIPETPLEKISLLWVNEGVYSDFDAYDTNEDGNVDYIEWVVPHLSDQTYQIIIEINRAEHLDSNRTFIEDVYEYVGEKDEIFYTIPENDFLRVTFENNLTNENDITLYAKGNGTVEVYEKNGTDVLISFDIGEYKEYKKYLTELVGTQNVFDLKVIGNVEFDYVVDPSSLLIEEINKLLASDGAAEACFGYSVSISGDYAIVGAYFDKGKRVSSGSAYIFKKNSTGQFEEINKITASDGAASDRFGYSVSISGDYAIVGAYWDDDKGSNSGSAYIFKKNSTGQFEEINKILASDGAASDYFGYSVSISGDYAIIGAHGDDDKGSGSGSAYIFKKNSTGQFEEINKITASDGAASEYFGYSVSISGDYAIVGAHYDDDNGYASGSAYIFKKNSTGQFEEVNKMTASDGAASGYFGHSVSISGDYAIVGAYWDGSSKGLAYIFKKNSTGQFEEINKITASDGAASEYFSYSVSISGDYAIVGAHYDDDEGYSIDCSAYIFKKNSTGQFEEVDKITASDGAASDVFGYSVSISGDYAIIGAYLDDDKGYHSGSAYVYNLVEVCVPSLVNTTPTEWANISCLENDLMNQSRYWIEYDEDNCGEFENVTHFEYQATDSCDYCTPNLVNTTATDWLNISCLENDLMNQSRYWIEYDEDNCGEFENVTHFEYKEEGFCKGGYFTFQINTTSSPQTFGFVTDNAIDLFVDWGDGTNNTYSGTGTRTHAYSTAGVYNVSLNGQATRIAFYGTSATPTLLKDVLTNMSDGLYGINSSYRMFRGCTKITNFTEPAFFDEVSSGITDMREMFYSATIFNGTVSNWNTSSVTDMNSMFYQAEDFNQPLNNWNTSSVTDMTRMFSNAESFNQPINNWDTSNVKIMNRMFYLSSFNQPLNGWNTSSVTDMSYMFSRDFLFNQSLDQWDVSNVLNMEYMFSGYTTVFPKPTAFNQDISGWNTSKVTNMYHMFSVSSFNQDLSSWDVSKVAKMVGMFYRVTLSLKNYDNILIGWSSQNVISGANPHFGYSKYTLLGNSSRELLQSKGWTITDGGLYLDLFAPISNISNYTSYDDEEFLESFGVSDDYYVDSVWLNDSTNFDILGEYSIANKTPLSKGIYSLKIFSNDSFNNIAGQDFSITILKAGCSPLLANTSLFELEESSCLEDGKTNQSYYFIEYDVKDCGGFTNKTYYNYQLIGPTYQNTTWSEYLNLNCLPTDYYNQTRNLTQFDIYGCATNTTYFEYQDNFASCDFCTPNMTNTTWTDWTNDGLCLADDNQQQIRSLIEYDSNECNEIENQTFYEYKNISCDYCTPNLINTTLTDWINLTCSLNQMNQSQFFIEYDENNCNEIENTTHYNYQLIGPTYQNTTWSEYLNLNCLPTDYYNQTRNLTEFDIYGCATNTTYFEFQDNVTSCDFCTPYLANTSWTEWENDGICLSDDNQQQIRSLIEYDSNECNEIENKTYYEYKNITCDYCTPSLINTTSTDWINLTCSLNQMNQSQFFIEYDENNCNEIENKTYYNYQLIGPTYQNTSWSSWSTIECLPTDYLNQTRNLTQFDIYGCATNTTYFEFQDNVTSCDFCTPSLANTSWTEWENDGICLIDDNQQQIRSLIEYDSNECNEIENKTYYEYKNITCDYCTPSLVNTSASDWINLTCSLNQMNQSQFFIEYDENNCNEIENTTHYNYQLIGPTYQNTSWSEYLNLNCLPTDYYNQTRNLTEFDIYGCATNTTYFEFQDNVTSCDFCTPSLANTSWTEWINDGVCLSDNNQQQIRSLIEYDSNECNEIENKTYYEYKNITCDYCTPSLVNTTKSGWENIGSCLITDEQNQSQTWTEYDVNNCGEVDNTTYTEYQLVPCDYCTPNRVNTSWSIWDAGSCVDNSLNQTRFLIEYDENNCYTLTGIESDLSPNVTFYDYNLTQVILLNTTKSVWNLGNCEETGLNQSRTWTQYDSLNLGCYENETFTEYNFTELNLVYTDPSDWQNITCSLNQMNQSRFKIQYDSNNLGCFENVTEYEYQLVGPSYTNGSWSEFENITECRENNTILQSRNITESDIYGCVQDNIYFEYQEISCDYCTPSLVNTTKSGWENIGSCLITDEQNQSQTWTEYDVNNCGEVDNTTYTEYQLVPCDYCTPNRVNTSWSIWDAGSCVDNSLNQTRFLIEYDENNCYTLTGIESDLSPNVTFYDYNLTQVILLNTTKSVWNLGNCEETGLNQSRTWTQYDSLNLGCYENETFTEYNFTELNLVYTDPSDWQNITCSLNQMNQSRFKIQYDSNNLGCFENVTEYEYQLVGPSYTNGSWSEFENITECRENNTILQSRNITESDIYGCVQDNIYFEYQEISCDYCTPSLVNTTKSGWENIGSCLITDEQNQSQTWTEYDVNNCGEVDNTTYTEYQLVPCDYCSYFIVNTSWSPWSNLDCLNITSRNQTSFFVEYDENYDSCYTVTGIESDLWNSGNNNTYYDYQIIDDENCYSCTEFLLNTTPSDWTNLNCVSDQRNQSQFWTEYDENRCGNFTDVTYYNYQLVGPTYQNTSWNDWNNLDCLTTDYYNQTRNLTQFDIYGCAINTTFFEYQDNFASCDFCTPNMTNTTWTDWENDGLCLADDNQQQIRSLIEYDSNSCNEIENQTFYEYKNISCDYCTPSLVNTSASDWTDISCLENKLMNQSRSWTEYDENNCSEVENVTYIDYRNTEKCSRGSSRSPGSSSDPITFLTTYVIDFELLNSTSGASQGARIGDKIEFYTFDNVLHVLEILRISGNRVYFSIDNGAIHFDLSASENKTFDLNLDSYDDFYIILNGVSNNQVKVSLRSFDLREKPFLMDEQNNDSLEKMDEKEVNLGESSNGFSKRRIFFISIIFILILLIFVILYYLVILFLELKETKKVAVKEGIKGSIIKGVSFVASGKKEEALNAYEDARKIFEDNKETCSEFFDSLQELYNSVLKMK